ncbi:uncharacterized protein LOC116263205 [Nymphaea colorata]|nr:uncharacterized protein LOC116263205 [Nymphaea colorata]
MGSLMAGWDSPFVDPERVNYERNKSFTREEIETFWKQRKAEHEAYCKEENDHQEQETITDQENLVNDQEKIDKKDDWWTRSSWAYLNEPPEDDTNYRSFNYVAQFHVAEMANKKSLCAN